MLTIEAQIEFDLVFGLRLSYTNILWLSNDGQCVSSRRDSEKESGQRGRDVYTDSTCNVFAGVRQFVYLLAVSTMRVTPTTTSPLQLLCFVVF